MRCRLDSKAWLLLALTLTACGSDYPSKSEISRAWQAYLPHQAQLYDPAAMSDLTCSKAGNQAVYCHYLLSGVSHSDVFHKRITGDWEVLMLNKQDVADD